MNQVVANPTSSAPHPGWRVALPALVLTLVTILLLFRETGLAMVDVWAHNGTYAHGMIVPPLTVWLIWRMRDRLALLAPKPGYLAVFLLAAAGAVWLLGEVATVKVIPQFALVCILVLAVVAVLGWQVARAIVFPLLFLLFAVPFGDFTQPKLMEWTAKFTVLGLRITGIPVYSEGQNLVIPSGSWSVVEACSGVRYLIASVTVGTLFAYLTYHSLRRRLIFVGFAILVPIVANWARAYMIVMLGHLSGNKLAVGVDHLIYGWVFFGLVIMAMFWIGARWREDELPPTEPGPLPSRAAVRKDSAVWMAAAATVLVAAVWPLAQWQLDRGTVASVSQLAPLGPIAGWQTTQPGVLDWRPRFENYAASTQTAFEKDNGVAGLFIGYYRNQDQQHKMITSTNVLVTTDDPFWAKLGSAKREIEWNRQRLDVRTAELRGPVSARLLVWQWYWVDGRWTASDFLAKAYTVLSRLRGKGDDSAVIILYALPSRTEQADTILQDFARAAAPAIENALQQTGQAR